METKEKIQNRQNEVITSDRLCQLLSEARGERWYWTPSFRPWTDDFNNPYQSTYMSMYFTNEKKKVFVSYRPAVSFQDASDMFRTIDWNASLQSAKKVGGKKVFHHVIDSKTAVDITIPDFVANFLSEYTNLKEK